MSQEMNILCCYSCEMFQVHIVKKAKKWQCKVCNEKQSIRRVYFQGSGKDCRLHVQQLNSQKQKGFESVQETYSNNDNIDYVSQDNKEASSAQQFSDSLSNDSEVIFDDAMQVVDEEYPCNEQTIDNCDRPNGNFNYHLTCEREIFERTSSRIEDPKCINSESFCYTDDTETKRTNNDSKENENIFESYEDFDIVLDF